MACAHRYITGDFRSLPPMKSNLVRIFTSSTFTDMLVERNYLMQNVYPQLRKYCQGLGLEFEVVDMRWGVNDDMSADHMTTKLCLQEIVNCQRLSQGPNFVALLGDKYGFCPCPSEIGGEEFLSLMSFIKEEKEKKLLHQWFIEDKNSIPATYILQPITKYYPHYNNANDDKVRDSERMSWWSDFLRLRNSLRKAAELAFESGNLSAEDLEKYFISVTETEAKKGVIKASSPEEKCICFLRVFTGIDEVADVEDVVPYLDVDEQGNKDYEGQERSKLLRFQKIKEAMKGTNLSCFDVCWKKGGISEEVNDHKVYLESLGTSYVKRVKDLLTRQEEQRNTYCPCNGDKGFQEEALNHAWFCNSKIKTFCGREVELESVRSAINGINCEKKNMIVLHGRSGCGKTALMAKVGDSLQTWLGGNINVVIRFLGTTPDSSNVHRLIKSILQQVCWIYHFSPPNSDLLDDINNVQVKFFSLLRDVASSSQTPLAIILDSLDQLSASNGAFSLRWLPRDIPDNIFLIVSTIAENDDLLATIKQRYQDGSHFVEVRPFPLHSLESTLRHYFGLFKRSITSAQLDVLLERLQKSSEPLLLKLLFDIACHWKSYDEIKVERLGNSVTNAISNLFERLERAFGPVLISHAFGYIAVTKSGLSEAEIEDILSLDNNVLNEVYAYWDPPMEGVIRLPPLLWKRIRFEVAEYLIERQADGVTVLNWYHRQFIQESRRRYLARGDEKKSRSQVVADYFLGTYASGIVKPILLSKRGEQLFMMARQVPSQPLLFSEQQYNLRKLSELPFALLKAEKFTVLYDQVLFNFQWILHKIRAVSVHETLVDYEAALERREDPELRQLLACLRLSSGNLQQESLSLASQLLGRLFFVSRTPGNQLTKELLTQAKSWLSSQTRPTIMPCRTCMTTPGGFLVSTFRGHIGRVHQVFCLKGGEELLVLARSGQQVELNVWLVKSMTRKVSFSFTTESDPLLAISKEENFAVVACSDKMVKVSLVKEYVEVSVSTPAEATILEMNRENEEIFVGFSSKVSRIYSTSDLSVVHEISQHDSLISVVYFTSNLSALLGLKSGVIELMLPESGILQSYDFSIKGSITFIATISDTNMGVIVSTSSEVVFFYCHLFEIDTRLQLKSPKTCCCQMTNKKLLLGGSDGLLHAIPFRKGRPTESLKIHDKEVWCLTVPQQNHDIAISGSKDDTLCVVCLDRFELLHRFVGHSSWIACVSVSSMGNHVFSGSNDKNVKLWKWGEDFSRSMDMVTMELFPHERHPRAIAISQDYKYAVSCSPEKLIVWDLLNDTRVASVATDASFLSLGKTSNLAIVGSQSDEITMFDLPQCTVRSTLKISGGAVASVRVMHSDEICLAASGGGFIDLFDLRNGEMIFSNKIHNKISCVEVCEDTFQTLIATAGMEKKLKLWSLDADGTKQNLVLCFAKEDFQSSILSLAFTGIGKYLFTGTRNGIAKCIDTSTGDIIRTLHASSSGDSVVCLLPYKDSVLLGLHGPNENLMVWKYVDDHYENRFVGHTHAVMLLLLSRDNKFLFSGSRDGTLKAWDVENGNVLDSIDLQSQVKHGDVTPRRGCVYKIVATAMSGSILIAEFNASGCLDSDAQPLSPVTPRFLQSSFSTGNAQGSSFKVNSTRVETLSKCCTID